MVIQTQRAGSKLIRKAKEDCESKECKGYKADEPETGDMRDSTPTERQLAFMLEKVDIKPIKEIARKNFPIGSKFRMVIEAEPDWIPRHEIVGKIIPWETLMKGELDQS